MRERKDAVVLGLAMFYLVMGLGVDLYWFVHRDRLPALAESSWVARMYREFAVADRGYYDRVGKMESALEAMNISVTPGLYPVAGVGHPAGPALALPAATGSGLLRGLFGGPGLLGGPLGRLPQHAGEDARPPDDVLRGQPALDFGTPLLGGRRGSGHQPAIPGGRAMSVLSRKDRFIVGLMLFYLLMAWTVELHFVWFHKEHPSRIEFDPLADRKSTRLNSSHIQKSRMPSSA